MSADAKPLSWTLVNGEPASSLPVSDRGLAYGDGLFETLRAVAGSLPLLQRHLLRLQRGCEALAIPFARALIEAELRDAAQRLGQGVIKLTVTRGSGPRGYAAPSAPQPTRILTAGPAPATDPARREGITLFACRTRLSEQPLLAGLKHLNRLDQVLARSEWQSPEFAEGLVCDQQGRPVECTMSNVLIWLDGGWVTPSLEHCGVRGVMRDYLLDTLAAQGVPVVEQSIDMEMLLSAQEICCCNSLIGVWPVVRLGEQRWPVGPQTRFLQTLAEQVYQ
tara:strand:- start:133 stop:966 length:834 start_codon:yes stop_codon:yes gene_type:complete